MPTDLIHVMLRRWYLVVAGLLFTVAAVAAALVLFPLRYSASADILLLPPTTNAADNPLLGLSGLEDVPVTIARSVLDNTAVDTLARENITSGYSITLDPTTSAPLLVAQATGSSPQAALDAMHLVAGLVPSTLHRIQVGEHVRTKARITSEIIHSDRTPTAITRTRTRAILAATAAGLLVTGLLATLGDRFLLYRTARATRARRATRTGEPGDEAPTPESDGDPEPGSPTDRSRDRSGVRKPVIGPAAARSAQPMPRPNADRDDASTAFDDARV